MSHFSFWRYNNFFREILKEEKIYGHIVKREKHAFRRRKRRTQLVLDQTMSIQIVESRFGP